MSLWTNLFSPTSPYIEDPFFIIKSFTVLLNHCWIDWFINTWMNNFFGFVFAFEMKEWYTRTKKPAPFLGFRKGQLWITTGSIL